jgi:hypothetical protein
MPTAVKATRHLLVLGRIVALLILAAALSFSGKFVMFSRGYGLVFLLLGGAALALMSYSGREIGVAFKLAAGVRGKLSELETSVLFWQSSARNFWMLGVFASTINFVLALTSAGASSQAGIAGIASLMAVSLISSVYGLILAVICLVPAWKLRETIRVQPPKDAAETKDEPGQKAAALRTFETLFGYLLFLVLTAWATLEPSGSAAAPLKSWEWIVNLPALLVVLGGTMAMVLFVGEVSAGPAFTLGFALTGLAGSLMGLIQALLGFSSRNIQDVASALSFIISSCFFGLLGMMIIGAPLEARAANAGKLETRKSALSQVASYVFPLITLVFLVIAFAIVLTPMKKQG